MYSYIVFVNGVLYKISVVIHQHCCIQKDNYDCISIYYAQGQRSVLVYIMPRHNSLSMYLFFIYVYIWYHVELGSDQLLSLVSMRVSYGIFCTDEENVLITIFQTSVPSSSVFLTVCSLSLQSISVQLNGTLLMNLISLQIWISHFILKC